MPVLEFLLPLKCWFHLQLYLPFSKIRDHHTAVDGGKFSECPSLHTTLQFPCSYIIGVVCVHRRGHLMLIY